MADLDKRVPDAPDEADSTPATASTNAQAGSTASSPYSNYSPSSFVIRSNLGNTSGGNEGVSTSSTASPSTAITTSSAIPIATPPASVITSPVTQADPGATSRGREVVSTPSMLPTSNHLSAATSAGNSTSHTLKNSSTSASDRLSNGAVAGVVIAVALGIAILTFLVTFFIMRRNEGSRKERQTIIHEKPAYVDADRKRPLVTAKSQRSDSLMNSLPQSADDATIQRSVEATIEQIGLHIENFYKNTPTSRADLEESELKSYDSTFLPAPLAVLLAQSSKATPVLKHTLSNLVTTSISPTGNPAQSLLPAEFVLLPSKTKSSKSPTSNKPEFEPCLSRWRQLTAYLLPNPLEDAAYRTHRNREIDSMVRSFSRAFGPWENPQYGSDQRSNSLSAIFKGASELGILLFSQPSDLQFRWPNNDDSVGPNQLAVTPTLVKRTDERGAHLHVPQVLVEAEYGRFS